MRAARVDEVVDAQVLGALSQPAVETVRAAAREALREHETLVSRRHEELRRAEHVVAEAERAYDQASPTQTYLKQRLAERLDEALRRLKELQTAHRLHPLVSPLALDDGELAQLRALLEDLPRIWTHPAIGMEDRKALVRRLVAEISVKPSSEAWTLDLTWVGGAHTSHDIPHHRGVTNIVREKYRAGATDNEIVEHLGSTAIVHRIGKLAGRPYDLPSVRNLVQRMKLQKPFNALAYQTIKDRRAAGVTHQAIADELNTAGIRHRLGQWSPDRVRAVSHRLVGPMAGQQAIPRLKLRVLELHQLKLSARQIAEKLAAEGVTTSRGTPVTVNTVEAVFRHVAPNGTPHPA